MIGGVLFAGATHGGPPAAGQQSGHQTVDKRFRVAQSATPRDRLQSASRPGQVRQARAHCRRISHQFREAMAKSCIRGDQLHKSRSLCVPPRGIFHSYSRWDPAAGRCKPRHRFDGGTCAGGKRRYRPGKHHAHPPGKSVMMYGKAPARLAAAVKSCEQGVVDLRGRMADERLVKQRLCAHARRKQDRDLINLYCR